MPIKLLALDIDGTLLNRKSKVTPRVREALDAAQAQGVLIALVTGRRFSSARPIVQELELSIPLVSHNGALTKNITTLETIQYHPFANTTACEVIRLGREYKADIICCDDPHGLGTMVMEGFSPENRALEMYLKKYWDSVVEVPDLLAYLQHDPIQIMFSGPCNRMDEFCQILEAKIGAHAKVFQTRYRQVDLTIVDVLSPAASKGEAVAELARTHNIAQAEIMAVGDNHNDLPMLRYAGVGVVMANAEDELKQLGFALTASNEEDGVAVAIEKFILQNN
ncbi:MAG TPA: Cof-type HAD-IIB family hydrolase [Blastocatellia bacterium]|nr:Cof-type HAD-IIB family hydrolase [Blastocatellia bacterium]